MSKMTDEQIKKALECCKELSDCGDCRYGHLRTHNGLCIYKMQKDALDLINRQQAEIERLNDVVERLQKHNRMLCMLEKMQINRIKSEAIKSLRRG